MSHTNPDPSTVISPKVIAVAAANVVGLAVVAGIAAITPDLFDNLGPWALVAYAAVASVGTTLAGYLKSDPLRR